MSLTDYLRRTTRRQHEVWLAWLDEQRNVPSRSDWYVMQNGWLQLDKDGRPPLDRMAITFGPQRPEPARDDEPVPRFTKESAAMARADLHRAELRRRGVDLKEV